MTPYEQVMQYAKERVPDAIREVYRHTDGTLVEFRYSDKKFLGQCPYDNFGAEAPPIPPELVDKVVL